MKFDESIFPEGQTNDHWCFPAWRPNPAHDLKPEPVMKLTPMNLDGSITLVTFYKCVKVKTKVGPRRTRSQWVRVTYWVGKS